MTGARNALYFLIAIIVIDAVGVLIATYLPMLQATLTKPAKSVTGSKMHIVSLSPGSTEMLFALGLGDSIVGVTDYCNYPPEAKQIERVGGYGTPNIEKLLDLSPDLVVAAGFDRKDVFQTLQKSGIRVLELRINNIDDMFQALQKIGDGTGKRRQAEDLVGSMQAELKNIATQTGNLRRQSPPSVFVELWDDPLTTVGGTSFLDDIISRAGGINVAHELPQPHLRISAEKVIEWNPDAIIVVHMARNASPTSQIAGRIGWSDMKAVQQGHIICDISSDLLLRPGPRLIEGVKVLAQRLREMDTTTKSTVNKAD
jgi:iron complex transport system substrate-binding protein